MHYEEYCKEKQIRPISPVANRDFYQDLSEIAMKRTRVLADIENIALKGCGWSQQICIRGLDILLSCVGIIVCAIPFMIIGIAIKLDSPGPVFFRQTRVGKHGKIFQMIKFRTMCQGAESHTGPVWSIKNDPRRTRVGAFLRETKLDELPQLFNILMGSMSFVGPRPERPEFVYWFVRYMPAFDRRHDVKPGLTGLAQLMSGYDDSAASVYRKLRWDAQYLRKKCLMLDLWLIYRTLKAVYKGKHEKSVPA